MTPQEHYDKAWELIREGKLDQAKRHFDEIIMALKETGKDDNEESTELLAFAYRDRSHCFFDKMDIQKALMDINAACELNPEDHSIWLHMGNIYGQMAVYLRLNDIVPPASRGGV